MAPHAKDQESKKAVLYARVSTEEQAKRGYSLAQQLEALREHAARDGYEVIEEVSDEAQSGASLDRPGLDRVRDLVAEGGVSAVLAQDRDRFTREPAYHYLLKQEFEGHGCKLRAMNDHGDDSPEGELTDGILDQLAKYERAKTAERTRRGKLRKAREGKVIAGHTPNYGFRYNAVRDGYDVDETAMPVVTRIFRMVGVEGATLHAVQRALEREGVPAPKGGRTWSRSFLRSLILEDAYKPHTPEEVAEMVAPEVAARLDEAERYGIWWFNRYRAVVNHGGEHHRTFVLKPRTEWIAVPIRDSGVPREWVDAAREAIKDNYRPKRKDDRYWELAGGILHCGECGRRMIGHSTTSYRGGKKRTYHYYVCPKKSLEHNRACENRSHRAEHLERKVMEGVSKLLREPARVIRQIEERIERERTTVVDPYAEIDVLEERLKSLTSMRRNYQDQQAAGFMSLNELGERLSELDDAREEATRAIEATRDRHEHIEDLEKELGFVLGLYAGMACGDLRHFPPSERRRAYRGLGLTVYVGADGNTEIRGDFESDFLPTLDEAKALIEGVANSSEQRARREEFRKIAEKVREESDGVVLAGSTPTCWASSTPRTPPSRR